MQPGAGRASTSMQGRKRRAKKTARDCEEEAESAEPQPGERSAKRIKTLAVEKAERQEENDRLRNEREFERETPKEKAAQREKDGKRKAENRKTMTKEQIERKRAIGREWVRKKRALAKERGEVQANHWEKAAFGYDPCKSQQCWTSPLLKIGKMDKKCKHCGAWKWKDEAKGMCCKEGRVQLPTLGTPPEVLRKLTLGDTKESRHFLQHIRKYNSKFQMTSFRTSQKQEPTRGSGFGVKGQVYHTASEEPLQCYFMDSSQAEAQQQQSARLKPSIIKHLQELLRNENELVKKLKTAMERGKELNQEKFKIVIHADKRPSGEHERKYNSPSAPEIGACLLGEQGSKRDIVIYSKGDNVSNRIMDEMHSTYDALQYPLIFWKGQAGYDLQLKRSSEKITPREFYVYHIMARGDKSKDNHLLLCQDLFEQFLVDMYAKIESEHLRYQKHQLNKTPRRSDTFANVRDAQQTDGDPHNIGKLASLSCSFTGGPKYALQRTEEALRCVQAFGNPCLFLTFTCNPEWEEIKTELAPGQKHHHRRDIVARVFRLKVRKLTNLLEKKKLFGEVRCYVYTVEWQKRGVPHIHMLLWLKNKLQPEQIDDVICSELPDRKSDPDLFDVVTAHMIHGPCGSDNPRERCMQKGQCSKEYPKPFQQETVTEEEGYPKYRRRKPKDGGQTAEITRSGKSFEVDNRFVVPYSPLLCKMFQAHINVEACLNVEKIENICRYINKGWDRAMTEVQGSQNEIKAFQDARYISSSEAAWRILGFPISEKFRTVVQLDVHLEDNQRVFFTKETARQVAQKPPPPSKLTEFFKLCKKDEHASTLLYPEVTKYYTWRESNWQRRRMGEPVKGKPDAQQVEAFARVSTVHPKNFELFSMRKLLYHVPGPTSFESLRSYEGTIHDTYRAACLARGLVDDDWCWAETLSDTFKKGCDSAQLRDLFAIMLLTCSVSNPRKLWLKHRRNMSRDILQQSGAPQVNTFTDGMFNEALIKIEDTLMDLECKTSHFNLPATTRSLESERTEALETSDAVDENAHNLTEEQEGVYQTIRESVKNKSGGLFFLDAPGGTGKTFLLNHLLQSLRRDQHVALAVANSGLAATLLSGGRTAHSTFNIPRDLTMCTFPVCHISQQSAAAEQLRRCSLIIWDEATMSHKEAVEAVDRLLKFLKDSDEVMGGITVLMAGDFRQTLPISKLAEKGNFAVCLKRSYLWKSVQLLRLSTNMRAVCGADDREKAAEFSHKLLKIGDGQLDTDDATGLSTLPCGIFVSSQEQLKAKVFPHLATNYQDVQWLRERAILAPRNDAVDNLNEELLELLPGSSTTFLSDDSFTESNVMELPVEFLNSMTPQGVPPYKLSLKEGAPIILLRNLAQPKLCNGTRLVVKSMTRNVLEATILTGAGQDKVVFIPRIPFFVQELPHQFKRIQFPVRLSFCMTINKSQGQTLDTVGLVVQREQCFAHGQLYVACSRVRRQENLFILANGKKAKNVVNQKALVHDTNEVVN